MRIRKYYHAMLDQSFKVEIVSETPRHVRFKFLEGPMKGEKRALTHNQAATRLS